MRHNGMIKVSESIDEYQRCFECAEAMIAIDLDLSEREFNKRLTIENNPERTQTMRAMLTLPVCIRTPVGETKMPEPMIEPTITVQPFSKLILALRPTSPLFEAASPSAAAPFPFAADDFRDNGFFVSSAIFCFFFSFFLCSKSSLFKNNTIHDQFGAIQQSICFLCWCARFSLFNTQTVSMTGTVCHVWVNRFSAEGKLSTIMSNVDRNGNQSIINVSNTLTFTASQSTINAFH